MSTKTVSGTTSAWLASYAISRGATPEHIDDLSFSEHDMTEQGWVKVGTADITVTLTDHDEYVAAQVSTLRAAKARPHTYLFTGGPGTGKTTLARILAGEFGVTAANLIEIDAGSSGGIDSMRDAIAPLRYQGFGETPNKAVIIDEAHQLSKQAWTSLLKTIEEPPAHVYFFFCTTEMGKVPENIRTRCAAYQLWNVRTDDLLDLIDSVCEAEGLDVPKKIRSMVAGACNGSPRLALVMLAAVQSCDDEREAELLLASPLENKELIDLCLLNH